MAKHPPLCRYCGKPIPKRTTTVHFEKTQQDVDKHPMMKWWRYVVGQPTNKAEAQRLVNEPIVSIRRHYADPNLIASVGIWDGESYVDPFFCNGQHAKDFAYVIARDKPGLGTNSWAEAINKQRGAV